MAEQLKFQVSITRDFEPHWNDFQKLLEGDDSQGLPADPKWQEVKKEKQNQGRLFWRTETGKLKEVRLEASKVRFAISEYIKRRRAEIIQELEKKSEEQKDGERKET